MYEQKLEQSNNQVMSLKMDSKKLIGINEELKTEINTMEDAIKVYQEQERNNQMYRDSVVYQSHIENGENLGNELDEIDVN